MPSRKAAEADRLFRVLKGEYNATLRTMLTQAVKQAWHPHRSSAVWYEPECMNARTVSA